MNHNMHDFDVKGAPRGGKITQEPLYPERHPKRIEQDSQRNNTSAPSPSKKKKENDRTLHTSSEPEIEKPPDNDNEISISDAETQSGDEHSLIMKKLMMRFMKTLNQLIKNHTMMLR